MTEPVHSLEARYYTDPEVFKLVNNSTAAAVQVTQRQLLIKCFDRGNCVKDLLVEMKDPRSEECSTKVRTDFFVLNAVKGRKTIVGRLGADNRWTGKRSIAIFSIK